MTWLYLLQQKEVARDDPANSRGRVSAMIAFRPEKYHGEIRAWNRGIVVSLLGRAGGFGLPPLSSFAGQSPDGNTLTNGNCASRSLFRKELYEEDTHSLSCAGAGRSGDLESIGQCDFPVGGKLQELE